MRPREWRGDGLPHGGKGAPRNRHHNPKPRACGGGAIGSKRHSGLIGLPVMDGYEVARRLKAHHSQMPLRLIALTGYGQKEDRERSLAAGFDEHLVKPITSEALVKIFRP
jgi:DNA-binding NarL/FixJ family response regulator